MEGMQRYGAEFARVYDAHWRDFSEGLAPALIALAEERPGERRMLDLCCGTGRLSLPFLAAGWTALGVDLSPDMVALARDNCAGAIAEGRYATLIADAATFDPAQLGAPFAGPFDAAFSLYDALNHLPSAAALLACFRRVRALLAPGAPFAFDLNTRKGLRNWNHNNFTEYPDASFYRQGLFIEAEDKAYMEFIGFAKGADGRYAKFRELMFNLAHAVGDVDLLLRDAGFRAVEHRAVRKSLPLVEGDPEEEGKVLFVAR